jgi:hypothetical protein
MNDLSQKKILLFGKQDLFNAALSNISAIIPILLLAIPALVWWFSESAKQFIEGDTYRIESIDRYATPSNTYTQLVGSERRSNNASTRIAIAFSGANPCSQQSQLNRNNLTSFDTGTLFGTMAPGLLATIRYTRRTTTAAINFNVTSGRILFIGMQGDLPRGICFNERKDQLVIEYGPLEKADISPMERILFIQTDEPASDVASNTLRERGSAYFGIISFAGVCIFVFLLGTLSLIIRNGRHDRSFRNDFSEKHQHMSIQLENVERDSDWIIENIQRTIPGQDIKDSKVRSSNYQELRRQGTADGEQRFGAGAADSRKLFTRMSERQSKSNRSEKKDPRAVIRDMKSDVPI